MPYYLSLAPGPLFEFLLACCLVMAALRADRLGRRLWVGGCRIALRAGRSDRRVIILAAVLPVAIRLLLLPVDPAPQPYVMEEFNHLLQAETYSLERLVNPVHPLAVMLQSYEQVEWPHAMSARPPLQALFLSVGGVLFHSPWIGNLLAVALTSAALCWMLLGWMPRRWAAIGSFLAINTFCLFGYWVNSFWCPTTIVLGGALLMGVVPRVERDPRLRWGAIFVVGLALLAGTRPYENGIYAGVICLWLAMRFLRIEFRPKLRTALMFFVLPVAIGGLAIILAQAGYNIATTGNYRLMPYQIWQASQNFAPTFLWQPMGPYPTFYYAGAARFAEWNAGIAMAIKHGGLLSIVQILARQTVTFRDLLGPLLFLPLLCWSPTWFSAHLKNGGAARFAAACAAIFSLLFLAWAWAGLAIKTIVVLVLILRWRNADERLPVLLILAGFVATSLTTAYMSIYFAAFTPPLLILVVGGLRYLSKWSKPFGPSLAGFIMLGSCLTPTAEAFLQVLGHPMFGTIQSHFDLKYPSPRFAALDLIQKIPGKHAVFVPSDRLVDMPLDPVWNGADVDSQRTVWLRDLRPSWTAAAQHYYQGRQFWLMRVDAAGDYRLTHYPSAHLPAAPPVSALPMPDRGVAQALGARVRQF